MERHHLFPKNHLRTLGVTEVRDTNQIANYALVEWGDNAKISDNPPASYWPILKARIRSARALKDMCYWHALPDGWEEMQYGAFLAKRRDLLAKVISDGYKRLARPGHDETSEASAPSLTQIIQAGESLSIEFKSTLRTNLHTSQADPRMEFTCIRTIAGFLNAKGGTLVIGVADDGTPVGLGEDGFQNEDKMALHLVNLIKDRIGPTHLIYAHPRFDDYQDSRVLVLECAPAQSPAFVREGQLERFFVRTGPSTTELTASQTQQYLRERFHT